MTPAEHLAAAERYLAAAEPNGSDPMMGWRSINALIALTHTQLAIAIEAGVPHPAAPAGGATSAQ